MSRILVTITPPTPNGGIHLGHLAGPFLAADVFARAQRQLGHEAVLLCYSDDHQSYLARKAHELGETEEAVCRRHADDIAATLAAAGVELDHFMRARDNPTFQRGVLGHFELMRRHGAVSRERRPVPYCEHCALYGYEAHARGRCNVCGEWSDASQCEACASAPDPARMRDLHCTRCRQPTGWRQVDRWVLDLGRFREALAQAHAETPMRAPLAGFIERALAAPDLRWPISRPHEHGVPVVIDGRPEILHTWFSGLAGYRACFEEHAAQIGRPGRVREWWGSPDTVVAHFLGFDCSYSHALAYRAILTALPSGPRQAHLYTNAFLKLDNLDFSTSRGHAIWARDLLKTVSADLLRLYLARVSPEDEARNFDSAEFARWHPTAGQRMAALQRAAREAGPVRWGAADLAPLALLRDRWRMACDRPHFSVRALAAVVDDAMAFALERARDGTEPPGAALAVLAGVARAVMPAFSDTLLAALGLPPAEINAWLAGDAPAGPRAEAGQTAAALA